jgi:hypothetical protein
LLGDRNRILAVGNNDSSGGLQVSRGNRNTIIAIGNNNFGRVSQADDNHSIVLGNNNATNVDHHGDANRIRVFGNGASVSVSGLSHQRITARSGDNVNLP